MCLIMEWDTELDVLSGRLFSIWKGVVFYLVSQSS